VRSCIGLFNLSEETASGQDTSVNDRTAGASVTPFGTLVRVDNQEERAFGSGADHRSWPFRQRKIIDVSQIAAHELGFSDLTKVCLKILSIPENRRGGEY